MTALKLALLVDSAFALADFAPPVDNALELAPPVINAPRLEGLTALSEEPSIEAIEAIMAFIPLLFEDELAYIIMIIIRSISVLLESSVAPERALIIV
ncbi:MAG: hypothetical protein AAGU74_04225 [Bacillota bacterium]